MNSMIPSFLKKILLIFGRIIGGPTQPLHVLKSDSHGPDVTVTKKVFDPEITVTNGQTVEMQGDNYRIVEGDKVLKRGKVRLVIWEMILDKKYTVRVYRVEPFKGRFEILSEHHAVMHQENVPIMFDEPGADDIGRWMDRGIEVLDKILRGYNGQYKHE